jgi:osmoprotectant transport system substrate-binding protein
MVVALLLASSVVAGCTEQPARPPERDDTIVVASFDFDESVVLAEVYAGALRAAGYDVEHLPRIGTREVILPALERDLVDLVPEYAGSAIGFLGGIAPDDPAPAHVELARLLRPRGLAVLEAAPAQSRNGLVVTTGTATELGLRTISDLREIAGELTLGGPPDCPERDLCMPGFTSAYGVTFDGFLPLDFGGPITAEAVRRGTVDVGLLFTSDGTLAEHDLVLLRDDRRLQPAENVTPVVREETLGKHDGLDAVIDRVSAALTTSELRTLNAMIGDGTPAQDAAAVWLADRGFTEPPG